MLTLAARLERLKPSATLAVAGRVKQLKAEGVDVIGFGAGEPDFPTPANIRQTAIDALNRGETHYMPVPGPPEARETIAAKLRRENGIDCTADDVVVTTGAKHALFLAIQSLVDPAARNEVIVPTPGWVSYRPMIELCEGEAIEVPGAVSNDFKITPEQLEAAITPRTAAMLINSPSNPCGTMYSPDELRALAEVLARHEHVAVLSDEIYEKLVFGDETHLAMASIPSIADRVVTINGLSKSYAMTGWRIGYVCAPKPLAKAVTKLQSQMTSHITAFCYPAIIEALTNSDAAVEEMRRAFAERARIMHECVSAWEGCICPKPTGAFYVFPDVSAHFGKITIQGREIDGAVTLAEALLEEAQVGVVPGDDFGQCARKHIRLSFACGEEQIRAGCDRIGGWLASLQPAALASAR